jgi:hypothetical protein
MRPSLKALRSRASDRAHRAAEGAAPPAGQDPLPAAEMATPGAVERGTIRRRLRRARRMRETLLTELGALVMEMHRQRRHDPALVERKAREALIADREALGLARAIDEEYSVTQVVAAGIAGACHACGSLLGTDDRYCSRCGTSAAGVRYGASQPLGAPTIAAPPPDPSARTQAPPPDPGARIETPSSRPPSAVPGFDAPPPPPERGARVGEPVLPPPGSRFDAPPPPDPGARVTAPAAPPPDPGTRVHPSTGDPSAPIAPRT